MKASSEGCKVNNLERSEIFDASSILTKLNRIFVVVGWNMKFKYIFELEKNCEELPL